MLAGQCSQLKDGSTSTWEYRTGTLTLDQGNKGKLTKQNDRQDMGDCNKGMRQGEKNNEVEKKAAHQDISRVLNGLF